MRGQYLLLLILLAGCIYETPQAQQISESSYDSSDDLFVEPEPFLNRDVNFSMNRYYPDEYRIKSVENIFDEINGSLDYLACSASSMRRFDGTIDYPLVVVISGALTLDPDPDAFFGDRINLLGFRGYSSNDADHLIEDGKAGIALIKTLLYSGAIPIVKLDRYEIHPDQALRYKNQSRMHESIFVSVVGYDKEIMINDPSKKGLKAGYQDIAQEHFVSAWKAMDYGLYFIWPMGDVAGQPEINEVIKKDLNAGYDRLDEDRELTALTRNMLYLYLKDINNEAALLFKESYLEIKAADDLSAIKDKIITIEKEATEKLK